MQFNRRQLLAALSATGLAGLVPAGVLAQGNIRSTLIRPGLWLITGAGANVVLAEGDNGVVVVDGGLRAYAEDLLAEINSLTDNKPVSALFNTNWRPEHTGLNHLLGGTNTKIIAHENTRLWQTTDVYVEWEDVTHQPLPKKAQANLTFYHDDELKLDGLHVRYGYMQQAHTDGDIYVHFPELNVLVVSDMLRDHQYPIMDYRTGGWIGGMRDASQALADMANDDTLVIPAEGGPLGKEDLQAQHEMLAEAYEVVGDAFRSGWSLEEFRASNPADALGADWGDPDLFLTQAYRGTMYQVPGRAVRNVV